MKTLYKFFWDCGRNGEIESIFIEDDDVVKQNIGKEVSFGEILGKHSQICDPLENEDLTILTQDQDFIEKFEKIVGQSVGYDPMCYLNK